jgi:hypothetical protein
MVAARERKRRTRHARQCVSSEMQWDTSHLRVDTGIGCVLAAALHG